MHRRSSLRATQASCAWSSAAALYELVVIGPRDGKLGAVRGAELGKKAGIIHQSELSPFDLVANARSYQRAVFQSGPGRTLAAAVAHRNCLASRAVIGLTAQQQIGERHRSAVDRHSRRKPMFNRRIP